MGDWLEQFVQQHREGFDTETPNEKIWLSIEEELGSKKRREFTGFWKTAAIILLSSTTWLLWDRTHTPAQTEVASDDAEFRQAQMFYRQVILQKAEIMKSYGGVLDEEFINDIKPLDQYYLELERTLTNDLSDQKIRDAMINNLQMQIALMDRQIEILESVTKKSDDETIQI